MKYQKTNWY